MISSPRSATLLLRAAISLWTGGACINWATRAEAQEVQPARTEIAGEVDLSRLLDLASVRLGIRVDYVPALVSGQATLRGPVSDAELWATCNDRLEDAGLTTVRGGSPGSFRVVKLDPGLASSVPIEPVSQSTGEGLQPALPKVPQINWPEGPRPGFASVILKVHFRPAADLAEPIKALLSKSGSSVPVAGTDDHIRVADLSRRLDQVLALLPLIDTPAQNAQIEEVPVRNVSPAQLVQSAKELISKRDLVAGSGTSGKTAGELIASPGGRSVLVVAPRPLISFWRELIQKLDSQAAQETREYVPRTFAVKDVATLASDLLKAKGDEPARIVADELTGTLVVTGTPEQQERLASLISRLDSVPADSVSRLRSFAIRHRPVKDVADALNTLLGAGTIDFSNASPSRASQLSPVLSNPAVPSSVDTADTAQARRADRTTGDRRSAGDGAQTRPPITMTIDEGLNTLIVVGEPRLLEQVEQLLKTLDVRQPQVMIEVTLVSLTDGQSLELGVELQKFGSLGGNAIQLASLFGSPTAGTPPQLTGASGTGFTGAVLNPGDFNAVIKALERVNAGRSSSTPRVLVANNQEASFKSVAQQPTSNTSTNTTSTTITSFGGFQDAGTTIRVKPQIADGDRLTLDYSIELSSFTGQPTGGLPSARQQNSVASVAQIPDGFTVIVGGFELKTESEDETRVPLLGQVPLVGELFKSRTKTNDRTRFFAFIRANVMRGSAFEELKYISSKDTAASNVDDGWPEVEPLLVK